MCDSALLTHVVVNKYFTNIFAIVHCLLFVQLCIVQTINGRLNTEQRKKEKVYNECLLNVI